MLLTKATLTATGLFFWTLSIAQSIRIGAVDIFGNRKIKSDVIRQHIPFRVGDTVTHETLQSEALAKDLEQIPGVKHARVDPICCGADGTLLLYIGIGESDSVLMRHRPPPNQDVRLPDTIMKVYDAFGKELEKAVQQGQNTEDDSRGYALLNYPPAKKEQIKFVTFAHDYFQLLETVLQHSAYSEQRAVAAEIIAYAGNRKRVATDLLYAIIDSDETVRNNAIRALGTLSVYVVQHPELKISLPGEPFINMLNSIVWTDRNKSSRILATLTQNRDARLLQQIRAKALPPIIEMAGWADRGHAQHAFTILGRMVGQEEGALFANNYSKDWKLHLKEMVEKARK